MTPADEYERLMLAVVTAARNLKHAAEQREGTDWELAREELWSALSELDGA
jgi:hypothetical protein